MWHVPQFREYKDPNNGSGNSFVEPSVSQSTRSDQVRVHVVKEGIVHSDVCVVPRIRTPSNMIPSTLISKVVVFHVFGGGSFYVPYIGSVLFALVFPSSTRSHFILGLSQVRLVDLTSFCTSMFYNTHYITLLCYFTMGTYGVFVM